MFHWISLIHQHQNEFALLYVIAYLFDMTNPLNDTKKAGRKVFYLHQTQNNLSLIFFKKKNDINVASKTLTTVWV